MELNPSQQASVERSRLTRQKVEASPSSFRVLTGDRPTGPLHIGHYFGTLQGRVELQNLGVPTFLVIADLQVITDRTSDSTIADNVYEVLADYLACGIDPKRTTIFVHSLIPELNQLTLPFLSLVSSAELERNPTVKDEAIHGQGMNGLMLTYPAHQAADILFCKANLVPVGLDQLPHLDLTRTIAKRFNKRYAPIFPVPQPLLSYSPYAPLVLGPDLSKMSKSRGNALFLKDSPERTSLFLRSHPTDTEPVLTYDSVNRPGVSNLLRLAAMATDSTPQHVASQLHGALQLKTFTAEAINAYFAPIRARRQELVKDRAYLRQILMAGTDSARQLAQTTLDEVRTALSMIY